MHAATAEPLRNTAPAEASSPALLTSLIRLVTAHPDLLVEHAEAHAAVLRLEFAAARQRLLRQALWWAATILCALCAAVLAGVAVLLQIGRADPGTADMLWRMASVPALPALLAVLCLARALGTSGAHAPDEPGPWARLQADLALFRPGPR